MAIILIKLTVDEFAARSRKARVTYNSLRFMPASVVRVDGKRQSRFAFKVASWLDDNCEGRRQWVSKHSVYLFELESDAERFVSANEVDNLFI